MDLPRLCVAGMLCALSLVETRAESVPETNALLAEVRIEPEVAVTNGHFGRIVAAGPGVFVVGFGEWADAEGGAALAVVYEETESGLTEGKVLRAAGVSESTVTGLATDGERVAVAVMENAGPGIYLFARQDSEWAFETKLLPGKEVRAVALHGGMLVAGLRGPVFPYETEVLVYELAGGEWLEEALEEPASARGAFGNAVDTDGERIIVGSIGDIRSDAGQAYIFRRGETGWEVEEEFLAGPGAFEPFAHAVAIDRNLAAISSYPSRFDDGYVTVYERVDGSWDSRGTVASEEPADFFGQAIALDGKNVVVAAPSGRSGAGAAYLFRWTGTEFDELQLYRSEMNEQSGGETGDFFGYDVAVEGGTVLAGAPYHAAGAEDSGAAFLFQFEFGPEPNPVLGAAGVIANGTVLQFQVSEVLAGESYVVEMKPSVEADWITVQEVTATAAEMEVEVEIAPENEQGFYRVRSDE